jgi:hypothetical protein
MKKLSLYALILVGISACLVGLNANKASSQTANGSNNNVGQALEIAPPVITLNADPGQTIKANINLRAIVNSKLVVTSEINDFMAAGEDGTPKIMTDTTESNPYSLTGWVNPIPQMTLNPKEIKVLPVTITVPANAAPGGYYGVVRFTARPPELEGTGVALSASLGSLLFVRVNGKASESMKIEEFAVSKNGKKGSLFESTPLQFVQRLKNDGNVFTQPAGQVVITDMFGKKIAAVNINLPPRNVLPQSIRKFEQPLDSATLGNKKLFGRYKAEVKVTYGDSKQVATSTITFWVLPYRLIGVAVVALVGSFFAFRFFLRRYNRRVISKAQNQNPKRKKK